MPIEYSLVLRDALDLLDHQVNNVIEVPIRKENDVRI